MLTDFKLGLLALTLYAYACLSFLSWRLRKRYFVLIGWIFGNICFALLVGYVAGVVDDCGCNPDMSVWVFKFLQIVFGVFQISLMFFLSCFEHSLNLMRFRMNWRIIFCLAFSHLACRAGFFWSLVVKRALNDRACAGNNPNSDTAVSPNSLSWTVAGNIFWTVSALVSRC